MNINWSVVYVRGGMHFRQNCVISEDEFDALVAGSYVLIEEFPERSYEVTLTWNPSWVENLSWTPNEQITSPQTRIARCINLFYNEELERYDPVGVLIILAS